MTTGLVATLLAALLRRAPALYSALDSGPYDTWLTLHICSLPRVPISCSSFATNPLISTGTGLWDRSLVACITALRRRPAIGIDLPIDRTQPPEPRWGGERRPPDRSHQVCRVCGVSAVPSVLIGSDPTLGIIRQGHTSPGTRVHPSRTRSDRVVRRLPPRAMSAPLISRPLASSYKVKSTAEHPNTERLCPSSTNLLLSVVVTEALMAFRSISFADFMKLLDGKHGDELDHMISGKIAVLLLQPRQAPLPASSGQGSVRRLAARASAQYLADLSLIHTIRPVVGWRWRLRSLPGSPT
ncbi:MAG: hypothetical protein U0231_10520 [Nitrospiraceae bacterium]